MRVREKEEKKKKKKEKKPLSDYSEMWTNSYSLYSVDNHLLYDISSPFSAIVLSNMFTLFW